MSPLNFSNSSFGISILTYNVKGLDEKESCETIKEFELLGFPKHFSIFAKNVLPR